MKRKKEKWKGDEVDSLFFLFLRDIKEIPKIPHKEIKEIVKRAQVGDKEALDLVFRANIPLVLKIAQKYSNLGVPIIDLIGEGNLALLKAIKTFDSSKMVKLSTYLYRFIEGCILNYVRWYLFPVKISARKYTEMRKQRDEKLPQLVDLERYIHAKDPDQNNNLFLNLIPHAESENVEEKINNEIFLEKLMNIIDNHLTWKERFVIKSLHGLDGHEPKNLRQIGELLGISGERVRQIKIQAYLKIRNLLLS